MIEIAVINVSTAINDDEVKTYLSAFQKQWTNDLKPTWGLDDARFSFSEKGQPTAPNSWWLVFLDDTTQADQLAYHDLTNQGHPVCKVFVKSLQADKASVSVGATHEICEMAVDPWLNGAYQDGQGAFWSAEICDPVQDDSYGYTIDGILVTDFVTPNWFAHKFASGAIDFKEHATQAFQVLPLGYAQKFDPQHGWTQVTGAQAQTKQLATAQHGSRRERRARGPQNWKLSEVRYFVPTT